MQNRISANAAMWHDAAFIMGLLVALAMKNGGWLVHSRKLRGNPGTQLPRAHVTASGFARLEIAIKDARLSTPETSICQASSSWQHNTLVPRPRDS